MAATLEQMLPILAQLSASRGQRRSLAELAAQAGRSPSSFQRAFSRLVGESPKQYTRRLQLECAAVLLLTTDDSVLDVALAAGFESHEGLTRAFARHFGRPPKDFRSHGVEAGLADDLRHTQVLTHVGPCLHLFRASTTHPSPRADQTMNYDITQQPIESLTLLCKTARCPHGQIAETLGKILPAIFQYATANGVAMVGPPTTLYVDWGPGMVTIKAGMPVAPGSRGDGEIEVAELPAGEGAVTIHTGSYDGLGDAHAAVETYLHDNGLTGDSPLREVYLTDPGETPDPADWKTQIVWPLRAAK